MYYGDGYPIVYCNGCSVGMDYNGGYPIVYCKGWSVVMEYGVNNGSCIVLNTVYLKHS